jgi:hypothetical protein
MISQCGLRNYLFSITKKKKTKKKYRATWGQYRSIHSTFSFNLSIALFSVLSKNFQFLLNPCFWRFPIPVKNDMLFVWPWMDSQKEQSVYLHLKNLSKSSQPFSWVDFIIRYIMLSDIPTKKGPSSKILYQLNRIPILNA